MFKKELISTCLIRGVPTIMMIEYYLIIWKFKFYCVDNITVPDTLTGLNITNTANKILNGN
jgi:hypothetical protein